MEVLGGHLTPCMSLRAAVNLHNLQGTDSDCRRMISEIVSLVSLILSYTGVHSQPPIPYVKNLCVC